MLTFGDVLEWVAGGCLIASAYVGAGDAAALAVAGVFLGVEAVTAAGVSFPWRSTKNEAE